MSNDFHYDGVCQTHGPEERTPSGRCAGCVILLGDRAREETKQITSRAEILTAALVEIANSDVPLCSINTRKAQQALCAAGVHGLEVKRSPFGDAPQSCDSFVCKWCGAERVDSKLDRIETACHLEEFTAP